MLSDINECSYSRGGCDQLCNNFPGSYNCSCLQGYILQSNKKSCQGTYTSMEYPILMNTRDGITSSLFNSHWLSNDHELCRNVWRFKIEDSAWEYSVCELLREHGSLRHLLLNMNIYIFSSILYSKFTLTTYNLKSPVPTNELYKMYINKLKLTFNNFY